MESWETSLLAELERLGEAEVQNRLQRGQFGQIGSDRYSFIQEWLRSKRDARSDQRADRALSIARRANIVAVIAMILSAATAIGVAVIQWSATP
jgi:hypothetical protein